MNESKLLSPSRVRTIRGRLLAWYEVHQRVMPWRGSGDPYRIWLSEIILQQTRVEQGTPYYERFIEAFPTVDDLARADEQRVMKLWEGLGYYSRARNLHKAAKLVSGELEGRFPEDVDGLLALPGVGRYTAGAIASIAFNVSTPLVDGNVYRVFSRLFDISDSIDDGATREVCWTLAGHLVPRDRPGDFNQALMELGAEVCRPQSPRCGDCPLARVCAARKAGTVDERPVRKVKKKIPERTWVAVAVKRRGKYLFVQRPDDGMLGGLWEFPTGELSGDESVEAGALRLVADATGLATSGHVHIGEVHHVYSHFRLRMLVVTCAEVKGRVSLGRYTDYAWRTAGAVDDLALHKGIQKVLTEVI